MEKKDNGERWAALLEDDDQEEEEEEALSLCDLPLIHHQKKNNEEDKIKCSSHRENQIQEQDDFDFCSMFGESEMCAADDVFFQGQILPLRHEEHRKLFSTCRSMSMSESTDHNSNYYSTSSSRSSSLNSNCSSSSSTSTVSKVPNKQCYIKPKLPPRNQFQYYSHPSPSPRLCNRRGGTSSIYTKSLPKKLLLPSSSSSAWNIFKLGLVKTPPEILNARPCSKSFGSRNSAMSSNDISASDKKKKQSVGLFFGTCKCSSSSVDEIRDSRPARVVVREMKSRSASDEGGVKALMFDDHVEMMLRSTSKVKRKHSMSHHRTFQWLKQLSIEGAADDDHAHDRYQV